MGNNAKFFIDNGGLRRKIPGGEHLYELVITKKEFIACYKAWIANETSGKKLDDAKDGDD